MVASELLRLYDLPRSGWNIQLSGCRACNQPVWTRKENHVGAGDQRMRQLITGAAIVIISNLWIGYLYLGLHMPIPIYFLIFLPSLVAFLLIYIWLSQAFGSWKLRHWVHPTKNFAVPSSDFQYHLVYKWCRHNCRGRWQIIYQDTCTYQQSSNDLKLRVLRTVVKVIFARKSDAALFMMFKNDFEQDSPSPIKDYSSGWYTNLR